MFDLFKDYAEKQDDAQPQTEKEKRKAAFAQANQIIASTLSNLCCSMRFGGELNVDLNEVATNLVPFRELNLSLVNYFDDRRYTIGQKVKQVFTCKNASMSLNNGNRVDWAGVCANMLLVRDPSLDSGLFGQIFEGLLRSDPQVAAQSFKTGLTAGGVDGKSDISLLRNGRQCGDVLRGVAGQFQALRAKRMYLHHYLRFMEEAELDGRHEAVRAVVAAYDALGAAGRAERCAEERARLEHRVRQLLI